MRRLSLDESGSPGSPDAGVRGGGGGNVYRLVRDPAVDSATPAQYATVGLAGNPDPPVVLGAQTSQLDAAGDSRMTKADRPGFWKTLLFGPRERDTDHENRGTLAPGNIRRNVTYRANGVGAPGFFSWAGNAPSLPPLPLEPARPPQDEYLVSSRFLGLADSLATVVSETTKPAPGLEPFRGGETIQAQPSTGWPTVAPQVPSFGSRVPLRRPRGLVGTSQEGS